MRLVTSMALKPKYRCGRRGCRKIYHLPKPPEAYKITKKCSCGGNLHYYADRERNRKRNCRCDGLPWSMAGGPHHKGSSVWCIHHPTGPTDEDFEDRYR